MYYVGIAAGIAAMVCWGVSDFFAARASRKNHAFKVFMLSQSISTVILAVIYLLFFGPVQLTDFSVELLAVTGFLGFASYLVYYNGLEIGKVSLVTPISAGWAAITAIIGILFLSEELTNLQIVAITLIIVGSMIAAIRLHEAKKTLKSKTRSKSIWDAFFTLITWGFYFALISILTVTVSPFFVIFAVKGFAVLYGFAYSKAEKRDLSMPKFSLGSIFAVGVLEALAFIAYAIGVTSAYTAIVAPITAASPMITVTLARIYFKERFEFEEAVGVTLILFGLLMLSSGLVFL